MVNHVVRGHSAAGVFWCMLCFFWCDMVVVIIIHGPHVYVHTTTIMMEVSMKSALLLLIFYRALWSFFMDRVSFVRHDQNLLSNRNK